MTLIDEIAAIFDDTFAYDRDRFSIDTVPEDVKKWDSIGHMSMVAAMEEKFGLEFEVDEIMEMVDVRKIVAILETKGVGTDA